MFSSLAQQGTSSTAESVGHRLAELGDQIDAMYGDELTEIVQLAGGSEQAFQSFHSVVWSVFDRDENGFRKSQFVHSTCMFFILRNT